MKKNIVGLLVLAFISCNPVGENLGEVQLIQKGISSIEGLDLKEGDEIVFWTKLSTRKDSTFSKYKMRYSISQDDKIVKFDSLNIADGAHSINSKTTQEGITHSSAEGKDSIEYVKNWEFEIENNSFIVPKDGKYNFDFKLYLPEMDFFASNQSSASVIVRKR
ncbi:hypothetical protein [Flavobacterium sp. H122]|uniref:hypothetical protein n=1 Tax=Flavobacterium sp. H122 TaxID=2529860 RepID=UPI0010AA0531|nr:hypothetical protein [Flavobacterium sp. H122]